MQIPFHSESETGSLSERNLIYAGAGPSQSSVVAYTLDVFDAAIVGTIRLIFRWTDPFDVACVEQTTAVSVAGTGPVLNGGFTAWQKGDTHITIEVVAAISLGSLEYGLIILSDSTNSPPYPE